MKLRAWHNSNLGHPHFERDVPDLAAAKAWLRLLADYDLYQRERVAANAQGLMQWNEKLRDWEDWEDDDGNSITSVMDGEIENVKIETEFKSKCHCGGIRFRSERQPAEIAAKIYILTCDNCYERTAISEALAKRLKLVPRERKVLKISSRELSRRKTGR